eukprot:scaffold445636_cov98-Attheya_sp.AAC.1
MMTPNYQDGSLQGKEGLWDMLLSRNVSSIDAEYWESVPSGATIAKLHGERPVILGLERCEAFRLQTDPMKRHIAPAGMFSTGTNLLSVLLEYNCQNPVRVAKMGDKRGHGNSWEVPWGKHTPAIFRANFTKGHPNYDKSEVLPVVLVRNPYSWMKSICRNSYTIRFQDRNKKTCPRLKTSTTNNNNNDISNNWNKVTVRYGAGTMHHESVAHLWNEWNGFYYHDPELPRLM